MIKKFGGLTLTVLASLLLAESNALSIEALLTEDGEMEMMGDATDQVPAASDNSPAEETPVDNSSSGAQGSSAPQYYDASAAANPHDGYGAGGDCGKACGNNVNIDINFSVNIKPTSASGDDDSADADGEALGT